MMQKHVWLRIAFLSGCWAGLVESAFAHGAKQEGHSAPEISPANWDELWRAWAFEPGVVIPLVLTGWLYVRGVRRLWRQAGTGRGIRGWEAACFAGGWLALVIALVSPIHSWGNVLFSVHMTQHEILMLLAAPLLVLGRPLIAFLHALSPGMARTIGLWTRTRIWQVGWRFMCVPLVAWAVHAVVLWIWHAPNLFQAAVDSEFVHALQHASFLGSALLFWWAVIQGGQQAVGYGAAVLYMFSTALHSGFLGALITFSHSVWYRGYVNTAPVWGLDPLQDQQLGGLIMWVPACAVYIVAGLALFAGWLRDSEARVARWEPLPQQGGLTV